MQMFRVALVLLVIFILVNPTDAWGRRLKRRFKRIGKSIKKRLNPKKIACKFVFGVGCDLALGAAAGAIAGSTGGVGGAVAGVGAAIGRKKCHSRKKKCKRSVTSGEILLPYSDNFNDYDQNGDKLISYEEFCFAVMRSLPMANPEELREPFMFSDANEDEYLSMDEFKGAPLLFAHVEYSKNVTLTSTSGNDVSTSDQNPSAESTNQIVNMADGEVGVMINDTLATEVVNPLVNANDTEINTILNTFGANDKVLPMV